MLMLQIAATALWRLCKWSRWPSSASFRSERNNVKPIQHWGVTFSHVTSLFVVYFYCGVLRNSLHRHHGRCGPVRVLHAIGIMIRLALISVEVVNALYSIKCMQRGIQSDIRVNPGVPRCRLTSSISCGSSITAPARRAAICRI